MMPLKISQKTLIVNSPVLFPIVQVDNESSKEDQSEVSSPHLLQNVHLDFSSTRVFPSVPLDSGSSKENSTAKTSAVKEHIHPEAILDSESNKDEREVDKVEDIPITIQDAFMFCPMAGTFVLNKTSKQGIFSSEN